MATIAQKISFAIRRFLILLISAYQYLLSPWFGQQCRFMPTCSCYTKTALQEYGILHGLYLAVKRLLRCHPWCQGGVDEVPPKKM